ncbi:MAG: hypothetical protein KDC84_11555 [Crocinitomicaceae bacterium]|nr:hypothetical protein [Crocinitomicaceae bacterium]
MIEINQIKTVPYGEKIFNFSEFVHELREIKIDCEVIYIGLQSSSINPEIIKYHNYYIIGIDQGLLIYNTENNETIFKKLDWNYSFSKIMDRKLFVFAGPSLIVFEGSSEIVSKTFPDIVDSIEQINKSEYNIHLFDESKIIFKLTDYKK